MSKYNAVYDDLYQKNLDGFYADGEKLPSETQMVLQYQVSRQTIRHALRYLEQNNLIRKVQGSGSFVSFAIPQLKTKRIAVVVYDFTESVFPSILSKLEDVLFQKGYITVLVSTLGQIDKERQLLLYFRENHVDGIILQPEYSTLKWTNMDLAQELQTIGTKFVFMDSRYSDPELFDIPCVSMNNYSAAYHIASSLIAAGYRLIGGLFRLRSAQILDRFHGVRQAIVDRGIPYQEDSFLIAEGIRSLKWQLNDESFQKFQEQEAIICGTGEYAPHLIQMLQKNGRGKIRTVVIFDEVEIPQIDGVTFVTLRYAGSEIGQLCAEKILNEVHGIRETSVTVPWSVQSHFAGV